MAWLVTIEEIIRFGRTSVDEDHAAVIIRSARKGKEYYIYRMGEDWR